ncbi:MAG: NifU family protein [Lentisphaerae bacterium]|nr:NifU family protein [Lentisphaerota bacterium]
MATAPKTPAAVDIFVQETPSPRAHKLIIDRLIQSGPDAGYNADTGAEGAGPMVTAILTTPHVTHAYLSTNVITITHDRETDWPVLEKEIRARICATIAMHDPAFHPNRSGTTVTADATENDQDLADIARLLDRSVRPYIESHGGEIYLLAYDEKSHQLNIDLQGTCGDCAGSSGITLQAIEGFLRKHYDPQMEVIVAANSSWDW